MKNSQMIKQSGFTLIELLVVIVIIGILSTISTATFKSYFGKARDAERQAAVQNIALMIKVEDAEVWDDSKFNKSDAELISLFAINDFRMPKGQANICYVYLFGNSNIAAEVTSGSALGDNNEFAIATWGETRSTGDAGNPGTLADGTEGLVDELDALNTAATHKTNFDCASPTQTTLDTAFNAAVPGNLDGTATVGAGSVKLKINFDDQGVPAAAVPIT